MTKREQNLDALFTVLKGIDGPTVKRNADLPEEIPAGGWINLRDDTQGPKAEPEVILSPLRYIHTHLAEIEVQAPGEDGPARDAALDALFERIDAAIAIDRTLGGLAESVYVLSPDTANVVTAGAASDKAATLLIEVTYESASRLG